MNPEKKRRRTIFEEMEEEASDMLDSIEGFFDDY